MKQLEEHLRAHQAVEDAVVLNLPEAAGIEGTVVLISFTVGDDEVNMSELRRWVDASMDGGELPGRWLCINQMPKDTVGNTDIAALHRLLTGLPSDPQG